MQGQIGKYNNENDTSNLSTPCQYLCIVSRTIRM